MKDLFFALIIWVSMMVFAFWRRHVNSKKSITQLEAEKLQRRMWWSGTSLSAIICKGLLVLGMCCVILNIILQIQLRRKTNKLFKMYHGQVSCYGVSSESTKDGIRIKGVLFNGLKSPIYVRRIPRKLNGPLLDGGYTVINDVSNLSRDDCLTSGQEMYVEFMLPSNMPPNLECRIVYVKDHPEYNVITNTFMRVINGSIIRNDYVLQRQEE